MKTAIAMLVVAGAAVAAQGAVSFNGSYSQNFDSLASTNPTTTPNTNPWANNSTLPGWYLFNSTGAAITSYVANNGGTNAGSFVSYGAAGSSERALGGLGSGGAYFGSPAAGAVAGFIALGLTNSTGVTLDNATIAFDGEQWRNGGNSAAHTMVLEYGFGATYAAVATWTAPAGNFNWTSLVNTTTGAAVDGNTTGLSTGRGGTLSNLTWSNGNTLWFRWIERNETGNDHGLAIDNVSVTAVIPTPTSAAVLGLGGLLAARRRRA